MIGITRTNPWWTLVAVSLGGMMVGIDGTALTIAGPEIARTTGASLTGLQWIANSYLVVLALALLPAGRLADRFGRRATFLAGVIGFGLVSLAIAATSTTWLLIALRGAQGLCGALLQPAALALLRAAFPPRRWELALGIWGGASAVAIAGGPIVAGYIVQDLGWPVVFLINMPIALVTAALTLAAVAESRAEGATGRVLDLLRTRGVALGSVLIGLAYFSLFGLLFFLTLYLQNVRGLGPVDAGRWLLPLTAIVVLSAPVGGLLVGRFGTRLPVAGGLALICAGMLGFLTLDQGTTLGGMLPAALVLGFGTGVALIAATEVVVSSAPADMAASASAVQQVATQVGGVLGILVLGAVVNWRVGEAVPDGGDANAAASGLGPDSAAFIPGFHAALVVAAVVIAVGAVLAFRVSPSPARPPAPLAAVDR